MAKAKRGPGRPFGTGAGYRNVVRVLLTDEQLAALYQWQAENNIKGESEAVRLILVDTILKRPGKAKAKP